MEWMTIAQTAKLWGISTRRVAKLCENGRVDGAQKLGSFWVVPKDVPRPLDGRTKAAKKQMHLED